MDKEDLVPGQDQVVYFLFAGLCVMTDQIVYTGAKIVGQSDQGLDVGLCAVVFVFVDGLLGGADGLGQLLLADTFGQPQFS